MYVTMSIKRLTEVSKQAYWFISYSGFASKLALPYVFRAKKKIEKKAVKLISACQHWELPRCNYTMTDKRYKHFYSRYHFFSTCKNSVYWTVFVVIDTLLSYAQQNISQHYHEIKERLINCILNVKPRCI